MNNSSLLFRTIITSLQFIFSCLFHYFFSDTFRNLLIYIFKQFIFFSLIYFSWSSNVGYQLENVQTWLEAGKSTKPTHLSADFKIKNLILECGPHPSVDFCGFQDGCDARVQIMNSIFYSLTEKYVRPTDNMPVHSFQLAWFRSVAFQFRTFLT